MTRKAAPVWVLAAVIAAMITVFATAGGSATAATEADKPLADKVVLFAADGMRRTSWTSTPTRASMAEMEDLMDDGVKGQNGLLQGFPPNTGVGWYTLATGTWPSEHGSTNNTFHRTGEGNFNNRTSLGASILQADTIQQAAERAGKTRSRSSGSARAYAPNLQGPLVDFRAFFSNRGILLNYDLAGQPEGANAFGVSYQRVDLDPLPSRLDERPGLRDACCPGELKLTNTAFPTADNIDRFYDLYIYDSVGGPAHDRVSSSLDGSG